MTIKPNKIAYNAPELPELILARENTVFTWWGLRNGTWRSGDLYEGITLKCLVTNKQGDDEEGLRGALRDLALGEGIE